MIATKSGNVPTKSWRGKSVVFRMYSPLTSHGYSKSIKAVRGQRNLGLCLGQSENSKIPYHLINILNTKQIRTNCTGTEINRGPVAHGP